MGPSTYHCMNQTLAVHEQVLELLTSLKNDKNSERTSNQQVSSEMIAETRVDAGGVAE
jgi:hypothetical protein